jgi:hypothetical protein
MNCHPGKGEHKAKRHDDAGPTSAFAKACRKSDRSPASDYLSGAMLIEDVRHHYGHHHCDEGPDRATGALSFFAVRCVAAFENSNNLALCVDKGN